MRFELGTSPLRPRPRGVVVTRESYAPCRPPYDGAPSPLGFVVRVRRWLQRAWEWSPTLKRKRASIDLFEARGRASNVVDKGGELAVRHVPPHALEAFDERGLELLDSFGHG